MAEHPDDRERRQKRDAEFRAKLRGKRGLSPNNKGPGVPKGEAMIRPLRMSGRQWVRLRKARRRGRGPLSRKERREMVPTPGARADPRNGAR